MSFNKPLNRKANNPLYRQIYEAIRHRITSGELHAGDLLPSEEELRNTYEVSRFTLRQALDMLVREGLLTRFRRKGTFVSRPRVVEQTLSGFYSFAHVMAEQGFLQHSKVLEVTSFTAPPEVSEHLGVEPGETVTQIIRLRYADEEPLVLEKSYLPDRLATYFQPIDLVTDSIYDLLEIKAGVRVTGAREFIRPVVLTSSEAMLLEDASGAPAFHVERQAFAGERVVEWRVSLVRGDRYAYVAELPRIS